MVGGPVGSQADDVEGVYPRYGMPGERAQKAADLVPALGRLIRLLHTFSPDIIHFQWDSKIDIAYARLARRSARARLVFTAHSPASGGSYLRQQSSMIRLADAVIVHGDVLGSRLAAVHHDVASKTYLAPHGNYAHVVHPFPPAYARLHLGLPEAEPVFAFIGQLRARKGVETLLGAWARHQAAGRPGRLLIVGTATEPAYLASLERMAQELGIEPDWVVSASRLPQTALDLACSAATQVVLPFHEAGQSGSVIFAMTHGRCVVTTPLGEVARTVSERGILVPSGDETALADALLLAITDPEKCERLGRAAQAYVLEELSWSRVALATISAYQGLQSWTVAGSDSRPADLVSRGAQ